MSSLRKKPSFKSSQLPAPPPSDYVPQHPLYAFKPEPVAAAKDHLDNYVETRPFEDTEGIFDRFKSKTTLFNKLKALCDIIGRPFPEGITAKSSKKAILAAKKQIKTSLTKNEKEKITAAKKKAKGSHSGSSFGGFGLSDLFAWW